MSAARVQGNSVLLPNGKVLAFGGSVQGNNVNTASLAADLYDPTTGTFSPAGTCAYARLYHSTALLLPDATVLSAGSNPKRGTYEQHIEVYSPAYLFTTDGSRNIISAARPAISGISPIVIGYGSAGTFTVNLSTAEMISSVVLVRAGSITHAFDMDQRVIGLNFTQSGGTLTVNLPPNPKRGSPWLLLALCAEQYRHAVSREVSPGGALPNGQAAQRNDDSSYNRREY
jgi:hypothetical protein